MGLLSELAKATGKNLLDEPEEFIDAYHGSPHLFDKFDSSKIGTGEGAQAYSHGLYAAQREGTARNYRDALSSGKKIIVDGKEFADPGDRGSPIGALVTARGDKDKAIENLKREIQNTEQRIAKRASQGVSVAEGVRDQLKTLKSSLAEVQQYGDVQMKPGGHLYKVKIKTSEQNLLDWDTPLKDQPKPIQDKVLKIYSDNYSPEQRAADQNLLDQLMTKEEQAALPESNPRLELTGQQIHDDLVQYHNQENTKKINEFNQRLTDVSRQLNEVSTGYRTYHPGLEEIGKKLADEYDALIDQRSLLPRSGQPEAAQNLLDAGIPGVKYDDAVSRGKDERTKNYVIYSDELIDIAKRYGIPVATVSTIAKASGVTGLIAAGLTPEDAQAGVLSSGAKNLLDAAPERLKRAKEQGFDVDNPIYHGTSSEKIDAFDESRIGSATDEGHYGRGIYFASTPGEASYYGPNVGSYYKRGKYLDLNNDTGDLSFLGHFKSFAPKLEEIGALSKDQKQALESYRKADNYVDQNVRYVKAKNHDGSEGVMAILKLDGPLELHSRLGVRGVFPATKKEALENIKYEFYDHVKYEEPEKYPGIGDEAASLSDYVRTDLGASNLTEAAKSAGYDGIVYADETIVFDPKNIRSVDAEFDPEKTDSKNLLASPVPVTMGAGLLSAQAIPTVKDKAVAVGETLLDAGQAMIAPIAAAPHALIPALTSDRPTAQIEQGYQNLLQQMDYEPSTQLGQEYSQAAQQFMGDAFDAAAQSAPGQAIKQVVEPINLLIQQAPERARLVGRSLLDMSPF